MNNRVTKKDIQTLKDIIKKHGIDEEMQKFANTFDYNARKRLMDKAAIELQEEYYQKTGVYKTINDIYLKKIILNERQAKALERQMKIDYLNIKVPLNDFSFLNNIKTKGV